MKWILIVEKHCNKCDEPYFIIGNNSQSLKKSRELNQEGFSCYIPGEKKRFEKCDKCGKKIEIMSIEEFENRQVLKMIIQGEDVLFLDKIREDYEQEQEAEE